VKVAERLRRLDDRVLPNRYRPPYIPGRGLSFWQYVWLNQRLRSICLIGAIDVVVGGAFGAEEYFSKRGLDGHDSAPMLFYALAGLAFLMMALPIAYFRWRRESAAETS
jgi:hypothetical protein